MDIELLISIGVVFFLLCLSGFFSGSETALTAVSLAKMHALEKDGNKKAKRVIKIIEKREKMIGALLLGNNLVNILASAIATSVFIKLVGEAGVVYATLVMTMLVLIFAEVLPKTYAIHFSDRMAMAISPVIRVVIIVFSPVTDLVSKIVRLVLRVLGADISLVAVGGNMEELRGAIELHRSEDGDETVNAVDKQRAMLRSILDLEDVEVEEIMTHRKTVELINAEGDPEQQVQDILNSPYTRLPIYQGEQDNIVGVINVKNLLREIHALDGDLKKIDITKVMSEPWFVPESTSLSDQLQAFRDRREHFALVVDEYGSFMGVVTLEDILEEIVGEIEDETDEVVSGVRRQPNGSLLVEGTVTIRDLNREFEWDLPDEHYSTIAGLMLYETQAIPEPGQSFTFYGFRFDIVRKQRHQLTLIRLTPPDKDIHA